MIEVVHDSEPTLSFMADALADDWNGWAQPRFRSLSHATYVLGALCGAENVVMGHQKITFYDEDDNPEVFERDAEGYFTLHCWMFRRASDLNTEE